MTCDDSRLREALLVLLWHRVGEGALEADQVRPSEGHARRGDAFALHASAPVHQLSHADEYFFGVASAQRTGPSKGAAILDVYTPTRRAAGVDHVLGRRTRAQDNHINVRWQGRSSLLFLSIYL